MNMIPNYLMIGDWVYNLVDRNPDQIREVYPTSVMLSYNDIYSLDEIEPISLDEDFFIKNGYVKYPSTESFSQLAYGITYPVCKIAFVYENEDDCWRLVVDAAGYKRIKIRYVHELQHVLAILNIKINVKI